MDLYHTWLYVYILNNKWFIWAFVYLILGGNIVAPILLWCLMSGMRVPFFKKKKQAQ